VERIVFKAHRLLYHSTLGSRVVKKKKRQTWRALFQMRGERPYIPAASVADALQGFRVHGQGFRVKGSRSSVQGQGFRVQGSGSRVQGQGFRCSGFRLQGPTHCTASVRPLYMLAASVADALLQWLVS
jgi:hypothetical protein